METAKFLNKGQYEDIKEKLVELKKKGMIHVSLTKGRNKIEEAPTKIVGIYNHFICVQSKVNNYVADFTISYTDILTKQILIKELK